MTEVFFEECKDAGDADGVVLNAGYQAGIYMLSFCSLLSLIASWSSRIQPLELETAILGSCG